MFNKEGEALLGKLLIAKALPITCSFSGVPAGNIQELRELGHDKAIGDIIRDVASREWKIRLMAKTDYSGYDRKLQYQIVRCSRFDFAQEAKSLLETLEAYDRF